MGGEAKLDATGHEALSPPRFGLAYSKNTSSCRGRNRKRPTNHQPVEVDGCGRRRSPLRPVSVRSVSPLKWMLTSPPSPLAHVSSPRPSSTWPDGDVSSSGKPRMFGKEKYLTSSTKTFCSRRHFQSRSYPLPQQQDKTFDSRSPAEVCLSCTTQQFRRF